MPKLSSCTVFCMMCFLALVSAWMVLCFEKRACTLC